MAKENEEEYPKGSVGNPYTMEEYDSFEDGKFPGGFVGTGPGEATYYKADEGYGAGGSGSGSISSSSGGSGSGSELDPFDDGFGSHTDDWENVDNWINNEGEGGSGTGKGGKVGNDEFAPLGSGGCVYNCLAEAARKLNFKHGPAFFRDAYYNGDPSVQWEGLHDEQQKNHGPEALINGVPNAQLLEFIHKYFVTSDATFQTDDVVWKRYFKHKEKNQTVIAIMKFTEYDEGCHAVILNRYTGFFEFTDPTYRNNHINDNQLNSEQILYAFRITGIR